MTGPGRSRSRRRWWIAGAILGLVVWLGGPWNRTDRPFAARLARYRAAGEVTTTAELQAWHHASATNEPAGIALLSALNSIPIPEEIRLRVYDLGPHPDRAKPWPVADRMNVAAALATNSGALAAVRRALAEPGIRYPVPFPQTTTGPEIGAVRLGVGHFVLAGEFEAEAGRGGEALRELGDALRLARTLEAEPTYLAQVVRQQGLTRVRRGVERVLNRVQPGAAELAGLQAEIQAAEDGESGEMIRRALAGGRVYLLNLSTLPPAEFRREVALILSSPGAAPAGGSWGAATTVQSWIYQASGGWRGDRDRLLDQMDRLIAGAGGSEAGLRAAYAHGIREGRAIGWSQPISQLYYVSFNGAASWHLRSLAELRCTAVAVAVERYRVAEGALPAAIDALVPRYLRVGPSDPMDGQPLRYRRRPKGYVVYSVGESQADRGGNAIPGPDEALVIDR